MCGIGPLRYYRVFINPANIGPTPCSYRVVTLNFWDDPFDQASMTELGEPET